MDSSRNYYGGGGAGGGGRGYRGGGGGGGRHRPYRGGGRGRGGGGGHRNQPYRSRGGGGGGGGGRGGRGGGGGGGGGRSSSNRFGQQQQLDPDTLLLRQIASFVSRVGEFQNLRSPPEDAAPTELRSVEYTTASNINDLIPILLAPDKLERLLRFSPDANKVEDKVGKLVHLVVSCVADLPMQTPCYAALTLAVHEQVKGNAPYEGFITRCLQYAMLQIAKELDTTLLTSNPSAAKSTCRLKLLLRYLCMLGKMGIVTVYEGETTVDPNHMSIFGFVSVLVDAATAASDQFNNFTASSWLALIVLSTIPYLVELQIPRDVIEERLVKPLDNLLANHKSTFTPGTGITALLLKEPQVEEDDDQDDDEEEEEEEEEVDSSGQICDSLQDLLRATKFWRKDGHASRFALPMDAPWKGLEMKIMPNPDSGDEIESRPITYTDGPMSLAFTQECQLLNLLLSGAGSTSPLKLQYFDLEGAVFGRLPIFGSPPNPDDEEEDDEEDMEDGGIMNAQLEAFKAMSLLDRYFVAETLRDCLMSHESYVNPAGLQLGSAKSAAEELLRVCHVFPVMEEGADASKGFEFAILETVFALLAQCTEFSSLRHIYLSRVLVELVRLEPSRISQALAIAMTNLFQDYLPALVPAARENFSTWFAFHLINTDYQWPSAYWQLWEPYVVSDKDSSRGMFVRRALQVMAENISDPTPIVKQSFGSVAPSLTKELLGRSGVPLEDSPVPSVENEVSRRVWDTQEDPGILLEYLLGDEAGAELGASGSHWPRTDVLIRALLDPARQLHEGTKATLEKATGDTGSSEDDMEDDSTFARDVYVDITGALGRYRDTLLGVLGKDADSIGCEKDSALVQGGAFLLRRVESMTAFQSSLMETVATSLLQNRIVDPMSVMKWVLRDVGDSLVAPIVSSWSKLSIIAVRESLHLIIADATAVGSMTIDDGNTTLDFELVNKLTTKLGPMLIYTIERVCGILAATQLHDKKSKPIHVDLVEGTKNLVYTTKMMFGFTLMQSAEISKKFSPSDVEDAISKSELSGPSLSAICSTYDQSAAVALLKQSLEALA